MRNILTVVLVQYVLYIQRLQRTSDCLVWINSAIGWKIATKFVIGWANSVASSSASAQTISQERKQSVASLEDDYYPFDFTFITMAQTSFALYCNYCIFISYCSFGYLFLISLDGFHQMILNYPFVSCTPAGKFFQGSSLKIGFFPICSFYRTHSFVNCRFGWFIIWK